MVVRAASLALIALAACSSTPSGTTGTTIGTGSGTTSSSSGGANTVTGAATFSVQSSILTPLQSCVPCAADAGLATTFYLADQNITAQICDNNLTTSPIQVVTVTLAGAGYVACAETNGLPAPSPLAVPSTFQILNENVSDEDVCGNVPATDTSPLAILTYQVCDGGECNVALWAQTGSVTLSTLTASGASGTFDVYLGNGADIPDAGELKGTFNTTVCGS